MPKMEKSTLVPVYVNKGYVTVCTLSWNQVWAIQTLWENNWGKTEKKNLKTSFCKGRYVCHGSCSLINTVDKKMSIYDLIDQKDPIICPWNYLVPSRSLTQTSCLYYCARILGSKLSKLWLAKCQFKWLLPFWSC